MSKQDTTIAQAEPAAEQPVNAKRVEPGSDSAPRPTSPDVNGRHELGSPGYKKMMWALGAGGIATYAQVYFPQPILPLVGADFGLSAASAALVVSAATIGLAAGVLTWAWIGDRLGRDRGMKIALTIAATLGLAVPFVPSFEVLLAIRAVQGFAIGGLPALALAYMSAEVSRKHAVIASGSYISGTALGGLLGRVVAAPIAQFAGWRIGAVVIAVMAVVATVLLVTLLPRERHHERTKQNPKEVLWALGKHLTNPALLILFAQAFLLMGAYVGSFNFLSYRLIAEPFNMPIGVASLLFLTALFGAASARIASRFAYKYGRRPVLIASGVTMTFGIALTIPDWLPTIVVGLVIFTAAFFAGHAIASGWVGPTATFSVAQATALYTLAYYAGSSLFGWLGGVVFVHGWNAVVALMGGMTLLAALLAAFKRESHGG